jgi:hypothetical protein
MKINSQVIIESDDGQRETIQEVAQLERGVLRPSELGLTLMEAKALLEIIRLISLRRLICPSTCPLLHS